MPSDELLRGTSQFATLKTYRPWWQIAQFWCQVAQMLLLAAMYAHMKGLGC